MKLRVTGILLGILVLVCVIVPAFAAAAEDSDVSPEIPVVAEPAEPAEPVEPEVEVEAEEEIQEPISDPPFYMNGVRLPEMVYETVDGVCYVTVQSFVTALNSEAMIEEADGSVTISAAAVAQVVDVDGQPGVEMANVEEETLLLTAAADQMYIVANGRYLYVESGVGTIEGQVAVPMSTMARVFNLDIEFNKKSFRVILHRQEGAGAFLESGENYYDANTLYWLSRIIYSESGNQSLSGRIAVGNVVMNRLNDPNFPNTIKGVLFQRNQFSPAMSGSIYRTPNEGSVIAAKLVMDGAVVLENALFFNRVGMNTFASRNRTFVATIGGHSFYD